ncbi:CoB--CoM heterodisulfide reductase iron-sulfur subunit B family protein [Thermodesulfobacteriota bacterium]
MRYALFLGCQIPARVKQYESSVRAVLKNLEVELADNRQFNCCGYPMRNTDKKAFLLSSSRNLALAEKMGLEMLVLCKCCYGSLRKAKQIMSEDGDMQNEVLNDLKEEGLIYEGKTMIIHLLSLLHRDVGLASIKNKISRPYKNLKIAAHYGCHALRPSNITQLDDPVSPTIFEDLIEVTGAKSVQWPMRLECCGAPVMGINDDLSQSMTGKKLEDCRRAGANFLATACPYCQIQFDTVQHMMDSNNGSNGSIGSILYPQLLGISMGIDTTTLGIGANKIGIADIKSFLSEE